MEPEKQLPRGGCGALCFATVTAFSSTQLPLQPLCTFGNFVCDAKPALLVLSRVWPLPGLCMEWEPSQQSWSITANPFAMERPCPRLAKSLERAIGVPVRQPRSGGTVPGAGAGPGRAALLSVPASRGLLPAWRDSPRHAGLWRGLCRSGRVKTKQLAHRQTDTHRLFPSLPHPSSALASQSPHHGKPYSGWHPTPAQEWSPCPCPYPCP